MGLNKTKLPAGLYLTKTPLNDPSLWIRFGTGEAAIAGKLFTPVRTKTKLEGV